MQLSRSSISSSCIAATSLARKRAERRSLSAATIRRCSGIAGSAISIDSSLDLDTSANVVPAPAATIAGI